MCWLKLVVEVPFREIAVLLSTSKSAVDRTFRQRGSTGCVEDSDDDQTNGRRARRCPAS